MRTTTTKTAALYLSCIPSNLSYKIEVVPYDRTAAAVTYHTYAIYYTGIE